MDQPSLLGVFEDLNDIHSTISSSVVRVHPMMREFFSDKGISIDEGADLIRQQVASAKLRSSHCEGFLTRKIAKEKRNFHKMWITNSDSPNEPPSEYIERFADQRKDFPEDDWEFYFWVQDPLLLPKTMSVLEERKCKIFVKKIDSLTMSKECLNRVDNFIRDKKFPFASDILRMKILQEYGGLYADLGVFVKEINSIKFIVDSFEYSMIFWENLFYQNSFLIMPAQSLIAKEFFSVVDNPYIVPRRYLGDICGSSEGYLFSGLIITVILLNMVLSGCRVSIFPLLSNGRLIEWGSLQSWYKKAENGSARFGNCFVPNSGPSFLIEDGWLQSSR